MNQISAQKKKENVISCSDLINKHSKTAIKPKQNFNINDTASSNIINNNTLLNNSNNITDSLVQNNKSKCKANSTLLLTNNTSRSAKHGSQRDYDSFYNKCISWKNNRERKNQRRRIFINTKTNEECIFHPITHTKDYFQNNTIPIDDDYIYNKNKRWLENIELRKKEAQLEYIENQRKEQENFKLQNRLVMDRINNARGDYVSKRTCCQHKHGSNCKQPLTAKESKSNLINDINEIKQMVSELNETVMLNKKNNETLEKEDKDENESKEERQSYVVKKYAYHNNEFDDGNKNNLSTSRSCCSKVSEDMSEKFRLLQLKYEQELEMRKKKKENEIKQETNNVSEVDNEGENIEEENEEEEIEEKNEVVENIHDIEEEENEIKDIEEEIKVHEEVTAQKEEIIKTEIIHEEKIISVDNEEIEQIELTENVEEA